MDHHWPVCDSARTMPHKIKRQGTMASQQAEDAHPEPSIRRCTWNPVDLRIQDPEITRESM